MRTKILITILLLFSLAGCSSNVLIGKSEIPKELQLKADKTKILSHKVVKKREKYNLVVVPTSTLIDNTFELDDTNSTTTETVYYDYISDELATNTPLFNKGEFSNAEYLPAKNGKTPIAFYATDQWYKDKNGKVYKIKKDATTTVDAFEKQVASTLLEKISQYFARSALAIDTYNSSGNWTAPSTGTVEVLVVGGGGGGGAHSGGGGGAGGAVYEASHAVTAQTYTVTVGTGGAGNVYTQAPHYGAKGGTSTFDSINAEGGGGGAERYSYPDTVGQPGGCGGGGDSLGGAYGAGSQGGHGGSGSANVSPYGGGGGGGMGANGGNFSSEHAGDGGAGISNSITGSPTYYAGGGGGGLIFTGTPGSGGSSIGGNGSQLGAGGNGVSNTGSGGGGGGIYMNGGSGADGVVILIFTASGGGSTSTSIYRNIINFE